MGKNKITIISTFMLAAGLAAGIFFARSLFQSYPRLVCGNRCQNAVTEDRKFFADELFVQGESQDGNVFLLRLDLNRKKIGHQFQHYYFADLLYQNTRRQLYVDFLSDNPNIQPKDFLKSFSVEMSYDLSSREIYSFSFMSGNIAIEAKNLTFNGDFLVKNTLEYTRHVSGGSGAVTTNGYTGTANTALMKTYTPDYAKYVFFEGYETLKSLSQFFALWDSSGDFYLIDSSVVENEISYYKSHTWALHKNSASGAARKTFFATVTPSFQNGSVGGWAINIPEFSTSFSLKNPLFFSDNADSGMVSGTVSGPTGQRPVQGYFSYTKYGN